MLHEQFSIIVGVWWGAAAQYPQCTLARILNLVRLPGWNTDRIADSDFNPLIAKSHGTHATHDVVNLLTFIMLVQQGPVTDWNSRLS